MGSRQSAGGLALLFLVGCGSSNGDVGPPTAPGPTVATVHIEYRAPTTPRSDLPPGTLGCVQGVGRTHIHPSWRGFARIDLQAGGPSLWAITFTDAPVGVRLAIRISDGNVCDENPTGAATRGVFANGIRLTEVVPTPGTGTEPGLAFTIGSSGQVSP